MRRAWITAGATGTHTPKAFGNYFPALTNVPVRENNKANALVNTPTTHKSIARGEVQKRKPS